MIFLLFLFSFVAYKSNSIDVSYLRHYSNKKYIFRISEDKVRIFLRGRAISKAYLVIDNKKLEMNELGSTRGKQYFYLDIEYPKDSIEYHFIVEDESTTHIFNKDKSEYTIPKYISVKESKFSNKCWYQIYVDCFRNAIPKEGLNIWNSSWDDLTLDEKKFQAEHKWYLGKFNRRYGGDLKGILEKVDYLNKLGVEVVLLTPIFEAASPHGHDVINYEVDKAIGGAKMLQLLAADLHEKGIFLVVELPLTISKSHPFYKDFQKNGEHSKYRNWFKEHTFSEMASLNHDNEEVQEYFLSILQNLKLQGVDGVMINEKVTYMQSSGLYIINLPLSKEYSLEGSDTIFNMRTFNDVLKVQDNGASLKTSIELNILRYPPERIGDIVSVLSMVDSQRVASALINSFENPNIYENPDYKRIRPFDFDQNVVERLKNSLILFSVLPGSFMILYGDELGMWGGADPDSRKPMVWPEFNPYDEQYDDSEKYDLNKNLDIANRRIYYSSEYSKDVEQLYNKVLSFRKENIDFLKKSSIQILNIDDVLVIIRSFRNRSIIAIINITNKSKKISLPIKGEYKDLFKGKVYDNLEDIAINSSTILY